MARLNWRGAWASGTAYNGYDVVSWSGSSYDCIWRRAAQLPGSGPDPLALIAMAGIRGFTRGNPATILVQ